MRKSVFCLLALLFISSAALGQASYTVIDLGTLGGNDSYAFDVNDYGQVVGYSQRANGIRGPFLWQRNAMQDLGLIGEDRGIAWSINSSSDVVGHYHYSLSGQRSFKWSNGQRTELRTAQQWTSNYATSINDSGQVVGVLDGNILQNSVAPFLWVGNIAQQLPDLPGSNNSTGHRINNQGIIVGTAYFPTTTRAYVIQNEVTTALPLLPDAVSSYAVSINDQSTILGLCSFAPPARNQPTIWINRVPTALPRIPDKTDTEVNDINNSGAVVGYSVHSGQKLAHIYEDGIWRNLNTLIPPDSGWVLRNATAISDNGFVVGDGEHNGQVRAFLLVPVSRPLSAVLLVHGTFSGEKKEWGTSDSPLLLRKELVKRGFFVEAVDFATEPETLSNETYIENQAAALARRIKELQVRSGLKSVILICHSMGGLAARWYLSHSDLWKTQGSSGINKLIMLGTPNWGTDSPLLDPVVTVALARMEGRPLAMDTFRNWSPAIRQQFAEWQPAPEKIYLDARNYYYAYPLGSNMHLTRWSNINSDFQSPLRTASFIFNTLIYGSPTLKPQDIPAVIEVADYFIGDIRLGKRLRNSRHIAYYSEMASQLGKPYPNGATGGWWVNKRRASQFLIDLNVNSIDTSGAKVYLVAGNAPIAWRPLLIFGPFDNGLGNDGVVPVASALGIDPVTDNILYPHATFATVNVGHSELSNDLEVAALIMDWLRE